MLESLRQLPEGTIEIVLCRNEQSAAFMAAGHGRRTSKSGVVLVTSGPGVANLTTSLVTATCEGDRSRVKVRLRAFNFFLKIVSITF